jgi:3-methyladenine DNA glycosylase AlkD
MGSEEIRARFLANADPAYREFSRRTVVPSAEHGVIGIRMPVIREFAKEIAEGDWRQYLSETKDEYSEDLLLRGIIITHTRMDLSEKLRMMYEFIPLIDNWAVCDSFCLSLKIAKKDMDAVWNMILPLLDSEHEFRVRSAVVMMLGHFIDETHIDYVISYMGRIEHTGYYVRMAVAWCLSVCFIKFPERTMRYLENSGLDDFTFNKTISKITDSFRVDDALREKVRGMRRRKAA